MARSMAHELKECGTWTSLTPRALSEEHPVVAVVVARPPAKHTTFEMVELARKEVISRHCENAEPTVLLGVAMFEGLDLKDERARFLIFPKVPYPKGNRT